MTLIFRIIQGCVTLLALLLSGCLSLPKLNLPSDHPTTEQSIAAIDQWLNQLQLANKFNGAILIIQDSQTLLAKGYGYTNAEKSQRINEHTAFRLASLSKQFTAVAIMRLQTQQLLHYDDFVSQYIPAFPYPNITIKHLLNHTSGIPDNYMALAQQYQDTIPLLTNDIAVDLICNAHAPVENEPNETFNYSNTNYIILARIVEIVAKQSFESYLRTAILDPLDMQGTRVWNLASTDKIFSNKADDLQNLLGNLSTLEPSFIDGVAGDGAVFSSLHDLAKWHQFWDSNELISEALMQTAQEPAQLNNGDHTQYGFGWVLASSGIWHNGKWLGANTIMMRNRVNNTALVLLDNSSNLLFDGIVEKILYAYPDLAIN